MKTKKITAALAAGMLLFTGVPAYAAPLLIGGEVQFKAGEDDRIFDPESPILEHPNEDYRVINPLGGTKSPLVDGTGAPITFRIAFVPDLEFGIQNVSTINQIVPARALKAHKWDANSNNWKNKADWFQNFVQVTDLRGTATGWNLAVEMTQPFRLIDPSTGNPFSSSSAKAHHINGAQLVFTQGEHHTVSPAHNDLKTIQTATGFTLEYGRNAHIVMSAPTGNGVGFHTIRWGAQKDIKDYSEQSDRLPAGEDFHIVGTGYTNSPINLVIPANSMRAGRYRADLTWSLQDVPGNVGSITIP